MTLLGIHLSIWNLKMVFRFGFSLLCEVENADPEYARFLRKAWIPVRPTKFLLGGEIKESTSFIKFFIRLWRLVVGFTVDRDLEYFYPLPKVISCKGGFLFGWLIFGLYFKYDASEINYDTGEEIGRASA